MEITVKMAGDPSREQIAAREEVMKCEREIQSIKAALRRLGSAGNADEPNALDVVLIKVPKRVLLLLFDQLIIRLLLTNISIIYLGITANRSKDYRSAHSQLCICNFLVLLKKELLVKFMIHSIAILPRRTPLCPSVV